MSSSFSQDFNVTAGDDAQVIVTCFASDLAQVDISAATSASLALYITPEDPAPLATVTTTPGPSGSLVFGIGPPVPEGLFATSQASLAQLGTASFTQLGVQATIVAIVANIGALQALPTTNYVLSNVVFVTGVGYYQWSPLDSRTPSGTTIVAGAGSTGNWLLFGTVTISLKAAATALLAGWDRAVAVMTVTWSDTTTTQFLSGTAFIEQPGPP